LSVALVIGTLGSVKSTKKLASENKTAIAKNDNYILLSSQYLQIRHFPFKMKSHRLFPSIFALMFMIISCSKDAPAPVEVKDDEPEEPIALRCNGFPELCDKTLPEVSMVMTHNAYNVAGKYLIPNQDFSISRQLRDGVRGLMIDTYSSPNGPLVYHDIQQVGWERLDAVMKEIFNFLNSNPNEVVVIIFENSSTNEEIMNTVAEVGLAPFVYEHTGEWPSLRTMIAQNKRLVMMLERTNNNLPAGLLFAWEHTFDTPYSYSNPEDFSCDVLRGGNGKRTFFLVNHWLNSPVGLPDRNRAWTANHRDMLGNRIRNCSAAYGQMANFVGVDFYNLGHAIEVVDSINGVSR
jgi:hypothetical protein